MLKPHSDLVRYGFFYPSLVFPFLFLQHPAGTDRTLWITKIHTENAHPGPKLMRLQAPSATSNVPYGTGPHRYLRVLMLSAEYLPAPFHATPGPQPTHRLPHCSSSPTEVKNPRQATPSLRHVRPSAPQSGNTSDRSRKNPGARFSGYRIYLPPTVYLSRLDRSYGPFDLPTTSSECNYLP